MSETKSQVLLRIRPSLPDPEEKVQAPGPIAMESVLSAFHSLKKDHASVSLELGNAEGKIGLFVRSSPRAAALIESQMYSQYPDSDIEKTKQDLFLATEGETVYSTDLVLTEPELFPIKRHPQFVELATRQVVDPLAGITSALVRFPVPGMRGHVQIVLKPMSGKYRKRALKFLPLLTKGLPKHWHAYAKLLTRVHMAPGIWRWILLPLDMLMGGFKTWFAPSGIQVSLITGQETMAQSDTEMQHTGMRSHDKEDNVTGAADKLNRLLFRACVRISVIAPKGSAEEAKGKLEEIASSFRQFTLPDCNGFEAHGVRETPQIIHGFTGHPALLSVEEVATLWHVPNILVKTPNFDWITSRKVEPPVDLPVAPDEGTDADLTILGEAVFRGERRKFGIKTDDRRRHMYVIGKTGMGKSTLLENMIESDIRSGKGLAVIDPHGDLIDAVLKFIPAERTNDVILIEPADREFPVSFNMLSCPNPDQRGLVASGLMSIFMKMWPDAFSGRMEYILRNALLALLEADGNSMLGIMRIFSDNAFRARVMENVSDHMVKTFWEVEYMSWSDKYRTEAIAAIQNKIGQLLSTPLIRNIVGQVQSKLDIRFAMDSGKIVLANLSKGKLGEDTSAFIGSMLVTKFQLDAMSRADIPEKDRRDFYLYVDEFQNFATESFATILSEARKYRLNLTVAHQYIGQLLLANNSTALQDAVFGNVGSICSFQVGSDDAEPISMQFEEVVSQKDILSLPKYHAYMRLMIKGIPSKPFSVATLPPPQVEADGSRVEKIRRLSRERYAEDRKVVEDKIGKWLSSAKASIVTAKSSEKAKEKEEEEKKKAKAKKMTLDEYRKWRDREMWVNEYNQLRKKIVEAQRAAGSVVDPQQISVLSAEDQTRWKDLEKKIEETGGIPPPSKTLLGEKKLKVSE